MEYPKYELSASADKLVFEFVSNGTNGSISKVIKYQITDNEHIYNLAFGDIVSIDPVTGEINLDDIVKSNNGDMEKILATVASSAYIFTQNYPDRLIFFRGSTDGRTRLYRQAVSKEFEELSRTFEIYGAEIEDGKIKNVPFSNNRVLMDFTLKRDNMKTLIEPVTAVKYTINPDLNKIKSVKTKSNKIEETKKYTFEFKPLNII